MKTYVEDHRTGEMLKQCSRCRKYKTFGEYRKRKDKHSKYGLRSECRECAQKQDRKYRDRIDRFWKYYWSRVEKVGDCLEWTGMYSIKMPYCRWKGGHKSVRRLIYSLTCGEVPEGMFVLTTCSNEKCVRQSHIKLATAGDVEVKRYNNASDALIGDNNPLRRRPECVRRGEDNHYAKLTESDVRQIRELRSQKVPLKKLAQQFGVCEATISMVTHGKVWGHVT